MEKIFCHALCVTQIKFGTDGWRAVIAEDFTFENVALVAQATADYWRTEVQNPQSTIFGRELKAIVGYDRRFLSDHFARITAEVFAGLLTKTPPPVSSLNSAMPAALDPVIEKLLAKDRDLRYRSAEELLSELEAIPASGSSSAARPARNCTATTRLCP